MTDIFGKPVAQAKVSIKDFGVTYTAKDGTYTLLVPGDFLKVVVTKDGMNSERIDIPVLPQVKKEQNFVLKYSSKNIIDKIKSYLY